MCIQNLVNIIQNIVSIFNYLINNLIKKYYYPIIIINFKNNFKLGCDNK